MQFEKNSLMVFLLRKEIINWSSIFFSGAHVGDVDDGDDVAVQRAGVPHAPDEPRRAWVLTSTEMA